MQPRWSWSWSSGQGRAGQGWAGQGRAGRSPSRYPCPARRCYGWEIFVSDAGRHRSRRPDPTQPEPEVTDPSPARGHEGPVTTPNCVHISHTARGVAALTLPPSTPAGGIGTRHNGTMAHAHPQAETVERNDPRNDCRFDVELDFETLLKYYIVRRLHVNPT